MVRQRQLSGRSARAAGGAALFGALMGAGGAQASSMCADLRALRTADASMTSAAVIGPGTVPGTLVSSDVAFCRVQGVARPSTDSEIKFEVWLPAPGAWTGRLKVNGTGGYAGATPVAKLAQDVGDGFVTAGSNMGHDGGENASWTMNRPEKVKDWGLRAHYSVTMAAKALANALYARPVKRAYFEGCSNGGRQALLVAQNYPQLFDGIVAGAPSNYYPDLLMWLLWTGKQQMPTGPSAPPMITKEKREAVAARVLAACDALDGAADGQITNPRACHFDVETLGPAGDNTVTAQELATLKAMYGGTIGAGGQRLYTGARVGSEAEWIPGFADNNRYGPFIGHYVYGVDDFDFRLRTDLFGKVYDDVKKALTPVTAAPSPDLRAFRARGGKIVQYHGWHDPVVTPDGSIGYFHALTQFEKLHKQPDAVIDAQIDTLTPRELAATSLAFGDRVRQFHRLFMLPNVGHCRDGSGPSAIGGGAPEPPKAYRKPETHAVSAVIRWVEDGVAPEKIVASRFDAAGNLLRQRPVCPYPKQAVYRGSGSLDSAENFECRMVGSGTPEERLRIESGDLLHVKNALTQRKLLLPNR